MGTIAMCGCERGSTGCGCGCKSIRKQINLSLNEKTNQFASLNSCFSATDQNRISVRKIKLFLSVLNLRK